MPSFIVSFSTRTSDATKMRIKPCYGGHDYSTMS